MSKEIDFYFDVFSPFAYLAHYRLFEIAKKHNWEINYHPVELNRLKKAAGNTGPANREIPPKIKYLMIDLKRWADKYGIPFGNPAGIRTERINKGTYYAQREGRADDYVLEAFKMSWGLSGDPGDSNSLRNLARTMDWDDDEFMSFIDSDDAAALYEQDNQNAIERGVFGVPVMMIGDQMWWGNDRLDFVESYILNERETKAKD